MLRVALGGIASKLFRLQFCRANVLFVVNLTHECDAVQFLSAHKARKFTLPSGHASERNTSQAAKLNSQNTQFTG